jgi:hypothetical protein
MASTSASSVSVLMEKPASWMSAKLPIRLTGMVTSGMMEARSVRRNTKTTRATSTTASAMVTKTDSTEREMNTEVSTARSSDKPGGRSSRISGSMALTALLTSSGLAVACLTTPRPTEGWPLRRMRERSSAAPSSTRATSRRRIGTCAPAAPRCATTMSSNCATLLRSVRAVTLNSRCSLSMRPAGTSRFWRRSASSTSCTVSL